MIARDTSVNPHKANLFSPGLRYRCHTFLDDGNTKTLFEVILATEWLRFQTLARIHWLVTDVLGEDPTRRRVIVVIGNLENTHYSEAKLPNEVAESIETLRGRFVPGVKAKLLEFRSYAISQEEINQIS